MFEQYGTYGAWLPPSLGASHIDYAPELERLGFQTIWVGIGADPVADMSFPEQMIAATDTAIIATAIVNMWQDEARSIANNYQRIVDRHGRRLLLGIGLGHPETRASYEKPYERVVNYVSSLIDNGVPSDAVVVGALGSRTLRLAAERTLGAHPYLTVPAHTRFSREVMGDRAFLAPEHMVVLTEDVEEARSVGRPAVQHPYLNLRNYTNNLIRHGFSEADVSGSGSDALIDALVAHGTPETIYRRLDEHLVAGANLVGIQVLTSEPGASPMEAFRILAHHRPS